MCGIVGIMGNIGEVDLKVFRDLMHMSVLRGHDGTGVAAVPYPKREGDRPEVRLIKSAGNGYEFMDRKAVRDLISTGHSVFIGHTRWRTVGEVNSNNSQPFDYPEVAGAHNGTISIKGTLLLEGGKYFGTDSEALWSRIDSLGLNETLAMLDDDDAMALVWYDKTDNTLHMYRNKERPLWYVIDKSHGTLYWASEPWFLYAALNRHHISFKKAKELPAFTHMIFQVPEKIGLQFPKPEMISVPMKHYEKPVMVVRNRQWWENDYKNSASQSARVFQIQPESQTKLPLVMTSLVKTEDTEKAFDPKWRLDTVTARSNPNGGPFYKTGTGAMYDREQFKKKMEQGCAMNGEIPTFGEPVKFLKDGSFICADCLAHAKEGDDKDVQDVVLSMIA